MTTLRRLTLAVSLAARVALSLDTYDVVVVGSGPGGLLAAELLSRDADVKVLVLEAGDVSLAATGNRKIPQWLSSARLTAWDVPGEYTHDANIFGAQNGGATIDYVDDRKLFLAQMVGGCSSVNAALYFRVPDAYVANTQWPFDAAHVNQRYDEMERDVFGWTDLPSTDGKRYLQEAYDIVSRALKRGGYSEKSINDAQARNNKPKTFGHAPFAIKNGERDSPAKTCWAKMLSRGNVKLLTGARVSYIKHSRGRATSVVYNDNVEVGVSDRGAVLMAAGAIGTPKVLIQSGIGPSDQLNGLRGNGQSKFQGIRANYGNNGDGWIVNENVGKNLFDTTLALGSFTHDQMQAFKFPTQSNGLSQMQSDYLNGRKGPLTTSGPVLVAYDNYIVQGRLYEFQLTVHATGFQDAASNDKAMGALLLINNPESRDRCSFDVNSGRYRAFTSDSLYMATGRDLAALQDFSAKIVGLMQQEGANFVKNSQQSLNDWVAGNRGAVSNHFGGTCYVSKDANDRSRCADDKLRVVGTSNIYVSDASAMRDGTVNPYGFIMYIGREVGSIVKDAIANPSPPSPPSPPQPEGGCTSFAIENGVDYSGNDLASPKSASSSGCCSLCSKQPGCGAFTWTSFEGGTCWLKSSKGKASNNGGAVSGYLQANQKKFTSCPVLETNVDYKGTDIGSATAKSADSCCSICQNKAGCGAFTWSSYQGGTCWLKSNKGSAVQSSGATSAVLQTSTCGAIEEGVDYTGKDIGNVRASRADDCCELCHKKNGCGAYSWSNQDGGTCWLKSEKGSAKNNQGVRSGVVNKSQPESLKKFLKIVFSNESKTPVVHFNKSNKAKNHEDQETGKTVRVHINIHRKSH